MQKQRLGLFGLGAFGQLLSTHLNPYFEIVAFDPRFAAGTQQGSVTITSKEDVASCHLIVVATPVASFRETVVYLAERVRPGSLVLDVGSVKVLPAAIFEELLPEYVDVVCTHPLFGPQSAAGGISGLKIVLCNIRGRRLATVAAFLRRYLQLEVIVSTPDEHDREAAVVQGLTHLIAKVLVEMEPLPSLMTTKSFDLLLQGIEMVRHDAPAVYEAIERLNPHARSVRNRFFQLAQKYSDS